MWLCIVSFSVVVLAAGWLWQGLLLVGIIFAAIAWSVYTHRVHPERLPAQRPLGVQRVGFVLLLGFCAYIFFGVRSHHIFVGALLALFAAGCVAMARDSRTLKRP
jgi:hypothetical protein